MVTSGAGRAVTPDGRYFVVRGQLWRCSNPELEEGERMRLLGELMRARRAKGEAMRAGDAEARERARVAVDAAKVALGERGPVWWRDGARDWGRLLATCRSRNARCPTGCTQECGRRRVGQWDPREGHGASLSRAGRA